MSVIPVIKPKSPDFGTSAYWDFTATDYRAPVQQALNFSRSSSAWYWNEFGVLTEAAVNELRIDHDPATVDTSVTAHDISATVKRFALAGSVVYTVGSRVRISYTANSSQYMVGTVISSASGTVRIAVDRVYGAGTYSDWTLIEVKGLLIEEQRTRLNVFTAAPTAAENITVTSVSHTATFFGTGSITLSGAYSGTLNGTGADDRVSLTFTPTAGTLTITPSGTVTNLQLEAGAFATSVILGEGSQVTRLADVCTVGTLNPWLNASEGTVFVEAQSDEIPPSGNAPVFIAMRSAQSAVELILGNYALSGTVFAQTSEGFVNSTVVSASGVRCALSYNYTSGQALAAVNGDSFYDKAVATDRTLQSPLQIGGASWLGPSSFMIGHIKSVRYYPRALTATELQELTA